ncbi:MAG: hydrogenase formation protein HypD [Proteobacteria bacterium]|nr:hydrogenase formation protein HypD [Pseudomonadota bacterium]MBU1717045.1 hydrogenase formation protein HypD [Pseudomonadota bacterium]
MKYLSEYRDPVNAKKILAQIRKVVTRPWVIMEVCGGQTHAIVRSGMDQALPAEIDLVHGPGCPVCVTPLETIDRALAIAAKPEVIFCSFGDMLRVPGSGKDLLTVRSAGGDVRIVYSPLEALELARQNPERQVVFLAIGFETTAPGNAMAIVQAEREGLHNFSELACHVLVPPAITALLGSPENRVQGYLAAGHVCTVMGLTEYEEISRRYKVPIVATGLEPNDILEGLLMLVRQLEAGRFEVENQYKRSVRHQGNVLARQMVSEVFEVVDQKWRGIGELPASGLRIRQRFAVFDAARKFGCESLQVEESKICISGVVLQGLKKPGDCPAFGRECKPEHPLGATMVSGEGACSAYYKYKLPIILSV